MSEVVSDTRLCDMQGAWGELVPPDRQYAPSGLFHDVQTNLDRVFPYEYQDSKTFPDCKPFAGPKHINDAYQRAKSDPAFYDNPESLKSFVGEHFELPNRAGNGYVPNSDWDRELHMNEVWGQLEYETLENIGSLACLPYAYPKPGGRFREFYSEHDGGAAAIGLAIHGRYDLIENMVKNGSYMLQENGFIPNANRSYYLKDRSQRPLFFAAVDILADHKGREETLREYLPALRQEWAYWTAGADEVNEDNPASRSMVYLPTSDGNGVRMGRYWAEGTTPRPESYVEDIETAKKAGIEDDPERLDELYRHIRAAAASGKDFSGVWCEDPQKLHTINTTDYIAVDLNCLLKAQSDLLSEALLVNGEYDEARRVAEFGADIERGLNEYCLDENAGWYFNYNFKTGQRHEVWALDGGGYPLFFGLARPDVSPKIAENLEKRFLREGGFLQTLDGNPEMQWGNDNGWAIDNYFAIGGLTRYGNGFEQKLAGEARHRFITMADTVYDQRLITPEKYDVVNGDRPGDGGEYSVQEEGFLLNNGPLLGLDYEFYRKGVPQALARRARMSGQLAITSV